MSRTLLVTGATGRQGSAVIDAILALPESQFNILAVTRSIASPTSQKLATKSSRIKVVEGSLDDCETLLRNAKATSPTGSIYGVYSVQVSMGPGVTLESEVKQGKALIDASLAHKVQHFVYSSVDRGGDQKSWDDPTSVAHFQSKYQIERYLRERAGSMKWTILRPVGFMDNLEPGMQTKVFLAALRSTMKGKKTQWVAVKDIGIFVAMAFQNPEQWDGKALGLAGDLLNYDEIVKATNGKASATFGFLGSLLMTLVKDLATMIRWFADKGFDADIPALKKIHPEMMDMKTWTEQESKF